MVAGHPVTPSDQVDQVWHLHLVYTRSYWEGFCGEVLGRSLHHGPTRGGAQESAKFHDWYGRTRESYRIHFGEEPPGDIWPESAERFGRDLNFARVNVATHWVIPRPGTCVRAMVKGRIGRVLESCGDWVIRLPNGGLSGRGMLPLVILAVGSFVLGGCMGGGEPLLGVDLSKVSGKAFLSFYLPLAVLAVVGSILLRLGMKWRLGAGVGSGDEDWTEALVKPGKVDAYTLILVAKGPCRTAPVQAALAKLVDEGRVVLDPEDGLVPVGPTQRIWGLHPVEEGVMETLGERSTHRNWGLVEKAASCEELRLLEEDARRGGYLWTTAETLWMRLVALIPIIAVIGLGIWRIQLGMSRGRPVGFLVMACLVLGAVAVVHLLVRPWRTPLGDRLVQSLKVKQESLLREPPKPSDPLFLHAFAIAGLAALPNTAAMESLRPAITPPPMASGDGGCGGDGGGGCGGGGSGGGGCGGCGG